LVKVFDQRFLWPFTIKVSSKTLSKFSLTKKTLIVTTGLYRKFKNIFHLEPYLLYLNKEERHTLIKCIFFQII
jgi:hypothetical protein